MDATHTTLARRSPPAYAVEVWVARLALLFMLLLAPVAFVAGILAVAYLGAGRCRHRARGPLGVLVHGIVAIVVVALLARVSARR
jgi:hypothetical protein